MMFELLSLAVRSLLHRRLRSYLTVLGVVIGVALVISFQMLGDGLKNAINSQIRAFGTDLLFVYPGKSTSSFFGGSDMEIRDRDISTIEQVDGVRTVMPVDMRSAVHVSFGGKEETVILHAQPTEAIKEIFEESSGFSLQDGAWPVDDQVHEIVLGNSVAEKTFDQPIRVGDILDLKGHRFTVSGILNLIGDNVPDTEIFISLANQRLIAGSRTGVQVAIVKVNPDANPDAVADDISYELSRQPGVGDISVITSQKAGEVAGDIVGLLGLVLSGIAAVAVVVAAVGIMNTMYTSVLERTKEIGVMKAIGATNRDVLLIFVLEAGIIGMLGGTLGALVGTLMAKAAEFMAKNSGFALLEVHADPILYMMVIVGSFAIGVVSGVLPARRAAHLSPVQALRYE